MSMKIGKKPAVRRFHQARWDEPVIFELSQPGQRGVLVPQVEAGIQQEAGDAAATLPVSIKRETPPELPEMAQLQVLRHFVRLSQENLGVDLNIDVGQGTCTMKYSPKVNDRLANSPKMVDLHPLQPEETIQGMLEVIYRLEVFLKEISGLDRFTLQPRAGELARRNVPDPGAGAIRAEHTPATDGQGLDIRAGGGPRALVPKLLPG